MKKLSVLLYLTLCVMGCDDEAMPSSELDMTSDTGADLPDMSEDVAPDLPPGAGLMLNELVTDSPEGDWFELMNISSEDVSLENLFFSDDLTDRANQGFFVGAGLASLTVPAGGFVVVRFTDQWPGFGLGSQEALGIYTSTGVAIDEVDWLEGETLAGTSLGRIPDGTGSWKTLFSPTQGTANQDNEAGATCGDGSREGQEGCDDGNRSADDGCDPLCRVEECGNGRREGLEECDDGGQVSEDGCDADCKLEVSPTSVVINEVSASSSRHSDWIELYNAGQEEALLTGWSLLDQSDDVDRSYVFASGTTLAPGAHLLVFRGDEGFGFGLGSQDQVRLMDASQTLVDALVWSEGQAPQDSSVGRLPDGAAQIETLFAPSPGSTNLPNTTATCDNLILESMEVCDNAQLAGRSCRSVGFDSGDLACAADCTGLVTEACAPWDDGVRINELSASEDDPIELVNTSMDIVDLSGWSLEDSQGALPGHSFFFAEGTMLEPGARLVLRKDTDHEFGLGDVDLLRLRNAEGELRDEVAWLSAEAEVSLCRLPDGQGPARPCGEASFGEQNISP